MSWVGVGIRALSTGAGLLIVGASAVQVGTANFIDPAAGVRIAGGLAAYCELNGIARVASLTGTIQVSKDLSVLRSWL
jgi:dihydroorotate dehydrogenase (NAD+) catalytic subunit